MAEKRVRVARGTIRPPLGRIKPWQRGSQLQQYLLQLQNTYRPDAQPFPTSPKQNEEEASQGIFNADHVLGIALSIPGPWFKQADVERWGVPPRITLVTNQIQRFREEAAATREARARWATHNKRIGHVKALIKTTPFFFESERQQVLRILDKQQVRLRSVDFKLPDLGITVGPDVDESKHTHWTARGNHLLSYLERAVLDATELERCAIAATILHFGSEGRFPRGARGALLVKARRYSSL